MDDTEIDFDRLAKALDELAAKPNPRAMTKEDYLREPKIYASLKKAWNAGYRASDIVPILAAEGFEIAEPTFEIYWRRIRKDMGDQIEAEADPKQSSKSKAPKVTKTAVTAPSNPTKQIAETRTNIAAVSPAETGGRKSLQKPNTMGGAFSDDV